MTDDSCTQERLDWEKAKEDLQTHIANPMDWDTSSESFQKRLADLREELAKKEKILKDCEANI